MVRRKRKPRASGDDPEMDVIRNVVVNVNPARAGMIQARGGAGPGEGLVTPARAGMIR